jgi:hypothetical protein
LDVDTDNSEFTVPPAVSDTIVGFSVALGPFPTNGETVAVRFTTPENPLTLEIVRPAVAEEPCERTRGFEFAVIVKPGGGGEATTKNTCTECVSFPLEPVRFRLKVPVDAETGTKVVNVEPPVPVNRETEFGFTAIIMPAVGGVAFRLTLPAKPLRLERMTVKVAKEPGFTVREGGAKPTLKSGAFTPEFGVPWINAEETYAPPATPMRRTNSKVYTGIGLLS